MEFLIEGGRGLYHPEPQPLSVQILGNSAHIAGVAVQRGKSRVSLIQFEEGDERAV